jgi:hypothetical protein
MKHKRDGVRGLGGTGHGTGAVQEASLGERLRRDKYFKALKRHQRRGHLNRAFSPIGATDRRGRTVPTKTLDHHRNPGPKTYLAGEWEDLMRARWPELSWQQVAA